MQEKNNIKVIWPLVYLLNNKMKFITRYNIFIVYVPVDHNPESLWSFFFGFYKPLKT